MPSKDIEFCSDENNKCRRRHKCWKFTAEHGPDELIWYGMKFQEYGQSCPHFISNRGYNARGREI